MRSVRIQRQAAPSVALVVAGRRDLNPSCFQLDAGLHPNLHHFELFSKHTCHAALSLVVQHVEQPRCLKGVCLPEGGQEAVCGRRVVDKLNTPGRVTPAVQQYVHVCQSKCRVG
jgi:hypothetical protein